MNNSDSNKYTVEELKKLNELAINYYDSPSENSKNNIFNLFKKRKSHVITPEISECLKTKQVDIAFYILDENPLKLPSTRGDSWNALLIYIGDNQKDIKEELLLRFILTAPSDLFDKEKNIQYTQSLFNALIESKNKDNSEDHISACHKLLLNGAKLPENSKDKFVQFLKEKLPYCELEALAIKISSFHINAPRSRE